MLSEKEYVKKDGSVCPRCKSDKITGTGKTELFDRAQSKWEEIKSQLNKKEDQV